MDFAAILDKLDDISTNSDLLSSVNWLNEHLMKTINFAERVSDQLKLVQHENYDMRIELSAPREEPAPIVIEGPSESDKLLKNIYEQLVFTINSADETDPAEHLDVEELLNESLDYTDLTNVLQNNGNIKKLSPLLTTENHNLMKNLILAMSLYFDMDDIQNFFETNDLTRIRGLLPQIPQKTELRTLFQLFNQTNNSSDKYTRILRYNLLYGDSGKPKSFKIEPKANCENLFVYTPEARDKLKQFKKLRDKLEGKE